MCFELTSRCLTRASKEFFRARVAASLALVLRTSAFILRSVSSTCARFASNSWGVGSGSGDGSRVMRPRLRRVSNMHQRLTVAGFGRPTGISVKKDKLILFAIFTLHWSVLPLVVGGLWRRGRGRVCDRESRSQSVQSCFGRPCSLGVVLDISSFHHSLWNLIKYLQKSPPSFICLVELLSFGTVDLYANSTKFGCLCFVDVRRCLLIFSCWKLVTDDSEIMNCSLVSRTPNSKAVVTHAPRM